MFTPLKNFYTPPPHFKFLEITLIKDYQSLEDYIIILFIYFSLNSFLNEQ